MRARGLAAAAVGAALVLTVAGCGGDDEDPVRPDKVALTVAKLSKPVTIGVVVSLQAAPGEGSEWTGAATGAQVAAYRFKQGGHDVTLKVVDDKGTKSGARDAIGSLVADGVSGIVVATDGTHLDGALNDAGGTPLLLPYATDVAGLPDDAWLTGPSGEQLGSALNDLTTAQGWKAPYVVEGTTPTLDGYTGSDTTTLRPGVAPRKTVAAIQRAQKAGADVVVADVPSATAASLVAALQATKLDLPVVLGRDGVSPAFGDDLAKGGGSLAGQMFTAGTDAGDVTSLGEDKAARQVAAYFAAVRSASGSTLKDLFGQGSYADQAGASDIASHDAVVAIVRAAEKAGSPDASAVADELADLELGASAGLAGPALDFTRQTAVADDAVVPLAATPQDPGARPAGAGAGQKLFWFVVPDPASD